MKQFSAVQTLTVSVRMRPCEGDNYKGLGNVVLQVIIDRKSDRIPLGIRWPMDKFDERTGELLKRNRTDQQCSDYNLEIGQSMAKANDICVGVRLSRSYITHKEFRYRFQNFISKDFLSDYILKKSDEAFAAGEIKKNTWKNHQTTAKRWQRFAAKKKEETSFAVLNKALFMRFRNWMRDDEKFEHNTIACSIKCSKTYFRKAMKENIRIDPELFEVKTSFRKGSKVGLTQEEVQLLKDAWRSKTRTDLEQECLCKFLFMTYTGLRISDANRVHSRHINNGQLDILQYKVRDTGKKVCISLSSFALDLIAGRKGVLFQPMLDQLFNKTIKRVAAELGIKKKVSSHVARFTFSRFLYEKTRNLKVVSELLGHGSIRTTEIYLQLDEEERESCMMLLEEL